MVIKSQDSALLAVDNYNKPAIKFRSYNYIILMCIAWLAFFHAYFESKEIKYYYREPNSRRYVYLDGEKKSWDLHKCVSIYFGSTANPIKDNINFFIGLRNKIEHSYLPALDISICGECQALLLNYEKMMSSEFGHKYSLSESLAIPLQLLFVQPDWKAKVLKELQSKEYEIIQDYINSFRSALDDDVYNNQGYSFRVFLIPKLGNRPNSSDLSVEFVHYDPTNPEEMEQYKKAVAIIKTVQIPVLNPASLKPSDVCDYINNKFGIKRFSASYHHSKCWKYFKVRPESDSDQPDRTEVKYCQYDVTHEDYIYTDEWVDFLISELSDSSKVKAILNIDNIYMLRDN